ncbi:MAG TPA: FecR domain-containing protein [Parasegetibacter sp.]
MNSNESHFSELFLRYLNDQLSPEEEQALLLQLQEERNSPEAERILQEMLARQQSSPEKIAEKMSPAKADQIFNTVVQQQSILRSEAKIVQSRKRFTWVAAASVLLLIAFGTFLFIQNKSNSDQLSAKNTLADDDNPADIQPGKEGAVLTLADGSQIVLDSLENGFITVENGSSIAFDGEKLDYNTSAQTGIAAKENVEVQWHTLTTPRGRQFNLLLPDGSRVWLNAASSIRFPVIFNNKERRVEVNGEAYFEVETVKMPDARGNLTNNKLPFVIKTKRQVIEVLGTHFNVNSYDDEEDERTTLLEGSVRVYAADSNNQSLSEGSGNQFEQVVLIPGQQAIVNKQLKLSTEKLADVDKVMAWKNGLFNFNEADLPTVMRQLSRWYDIEVIYQGAIPKRLFHGKFQKELMLSEVLAEFEKMHVKFELNGKTLTVMK